MRLPLLITLALATTTPALARDTRPSLCTASETPIFSCAMGAKIVSLCATPDLSAQAGRLTYRFGRPGKIELSHPEGDAAPREAFRAGIVGAAGGDFVRFSRHDTTYTLVYTDGPRLPYFAGLEVHRGAKAIARFACRRDPLGDDGFGLLYRAKLPSDHYVME